MAAPPLGGEDLNAPLLEENLVTSLGAFFLGRACIRTNISICGTSQTEMFTSLPFCFAGSVCRVHLLFLQRRGNANLV